MARAFIALGANLGDLRATLEAALGALGRLPGSRLQGVSSAYHSAPIDSAGPDYLNAVARLDTDLAPLALLTALQAIELQHGRQRPYRNAPRTLDLDLLSYEGQTWHDERLILPHPRLHERAFVLLPLLEIAPDLSLAPLGPLSHYLPAVRDQVLERQAAALVPRP